MRFICIRPILTNLRPLFPSWNGIVPNINRALKSADFSLNSIGDEGTAALSDALKANSTLETLELRSNTQSQMKANNNSVMQCAKKASHCGFRI